MTFWDDASRVLTPAGWAEPGGLRSLVTPIGPNPLKELLLDDGATLMPYGVEHAEPGTVRKATPRDVEQEPPLLAVAFGPIELEYASLRTDCVILDRPDRAVIEVAGADAADFLGRMLTQDVGSLGPRQSCNSFWLNRKGRIDSDMRVIRLPGAPGASADRFYLDMERGSVATTMATLGAYVITEEVTLTPRADLHRLSIHGPSAPLLLHAVDRNRGTSPHRPDPGRTLTIEVGDGIQVLVDRHDTAGVIGLEMYAPAARAPEVYATLLGAGRPAHMVTGQTPTDPGERGLAVIAARDPTGASGPRSNALSPESIRARPCGWFAYNIARIESGTPLFKIDFGPENLPAETGVIDDRVSFKKGCYLGQEIVARMHARGHPKQRLVALRFDDDLPTGPDGLPPLPVQGARVLAPGAGGAEPTPIGSITSSTFSPMLGRVPIALAMVAFAQTPAGTRVRVEADGPVIGATVQASLRFVP